MKKVKIGDVCDILNGFAFKSDKYVEKGIRIIRIANVQKGFIEDNVPTFYPMDSTGLEKYMLKEDDLLMSLTGNVGRVALLQKEMLPAALNQRVACLRLKTDRITKGFLFHILNSDFFEQQCVLASNGVAQKNMSTEWLKDYEIPLYSIQEQMKIADILDKTKRIIVAKNNELRALNELIKARFVEMFGDENNSKNWNIINVENVADVQVGIVIKPSQYYTNKGNGVKAFRSLNIGEGFIKDNDWVYFTEEGHNKNSKSIVKENDLLIVRSGAPGTACVVTEKYTGYNAIDIIIVHPDCEKINPYYLCYFTNMPHGKKQINEGTSGAAQQHFNVGKYNKLRLMLPPKELQDEFADLVHQIDKSKVNYYYKNRKDGFPPLLFIYSVTTITNLPGC